MKNLSNQHFKLLFTLVLLSTIPIWAQAGDIGALVDKKCLDCHLKDGNSKNPDTPSIAGISKAYFIEAMGSYNKDQRPALMLADKKLTMKFVAGSLSKDEIKQLSEYFSKQKYLASKQDFDKTLAKKGKKLHKQYCDKCHTENATSAADDAGILAGQPKNYLKYSLENYANGKRAMGEKMAKKFKKMNKKYGAEAIVQLVHFYASQQ